MESEPPASKASGKAARARRRGRRLRMLVVVLVVLEGAYLVAANLFLSSSYADRAIHRRPERLLVRYDSAWSPWPGALRVRGLVLRGQSRRVQWVATADRATGRIALLPLLGRHFEARGFEGRGVVFRLRRRVDRPLAEGETAEGGGVASPTEGTPPIPGLENPPDPAPEEAYPPPDPSRRPWTVTVAGLDLSDVSEIWVDRVRLSGDLAVDGGFVLRLRRTTEVLPSRLVARRAELSVGGEPVASAIDGEVRLSSEPFDHTKVRGWSALERVSAGADLDAQVEGLELLDRYLGPRTGVHIRGGASSVSLHARLRRGRLESGSRASAAAPDVRVGFLDYTAEGGGRVTAAVGETTARLAAELDTYRIVRDGYDDAHVQGRGLEVAVERLGTGLPPAFDDARVTVEIPPAQVPDLAFYNAYLPPSAGLEIRGGRGTIQGRFEARPAAGTGSGAIDLSTEGLVADLRGTALTGAVELDARFPSVDLDARRFQLGGTRAVARNVRRRGASGERPWAGQLTLREGVLAPGSPTLVQGKASGSITDVRPLLALAGKGDGLPGRILDVLGIDDVQASTAFEIGDRVRLRDLVARADQLRVRGDLALGKTYRRGRLLVTYAGLDVGFDLKGSSTDLKLLGARDWFETGR